MRTTFIGLIMMAFSIDQSCAETVRYVCKVHHAAGLRYNGSQDDWEAKSFASGQQYIFRKISEDENLIFDGRNELKMYLPSDLGFFIKDFWIFYDSIKDANSSIMTCARYYTGDENRKIGPYYKCAGVYAGGDFDEASQRFELHHTGAYLDQADMERIKTTDRRKFEKLIREHFRNDPRHPPDIFVEIGLCESL